MPSRTYTMHYEDYSIYMHLFKRLSKKNGIEENRKNFREVKDMT